MRAKGLFAPCFAEERWPGAKPSVERVSTVDGEALPSLDNDIVLALDCFKASADEFVEEDDAFPTMPALCCSISAGTAAATNALREERKDCSIEEGKVGAAAAYTGSFPFAFAVAVAEVVENRGSPLLPLLPLLLLLTLLFVGDV